LMTLHHDGDRFDYRRENGCAGLRDRDVFLDACDLDSCSGGLVGRFS
jgi:hypothetical protein